MTDGGPHDGQPIEMAGAPRAAATTAVVMLPGRGDSPRHFLRLTEEFHRRGAMYLAPEPSGKAWYPGPMEEAPETKEPWLSSAFRLVARAVETAGEAGVPPERTVLVGFSQGACVAAEFAAARPRRYGGVAVLAGGLFGPNPADRAVSGSLDGTPVYLGCGDEDPHVASERVRASAAVVRRLDADVTVETYEGLGHALGDGEMAAVRRLVGAVAGDESDDASR
ncbi:phospholipase/carboxylesterase [Halopelagius inordinatus]|uniref:Phospholipase/carboxylesterase n=1 Tax=Halopelagius inordinatus TaxID=553467 RepID=A0A1I2WWL6_9EURY|nr:phospholipase/carboxylesterase [Halopelagius inordinatus]